MILGSKMASPITSFSFGTPNENQIEAKFTTKT